ncbi:unnamed protein product [Somion occarium]|uniref:Nuclear fusion protein KAR5 n=1 Tax=Somion occarium TaxID=3059160 RepID=A0ABP1DMH7_9APHY
MRVGKLPIMFLSPVGSLATMSWFKTIPNSDGSDVTSRRPSRPDEEEIMSILHISEQFRSYQRRPDCFRRVAASIRAQCSELETSEDERIQAAISLTLCELATAQHSPPMECALFSPREEAPSFAIRETEQSRCVEALSRSAQYWSSYSGYLREVPQLCFAFRRWNDIDTAKEIYHNSTLDHIRFLYQLKTYEEKREKSEDETHVILQEIQQVLSGFGAASAALRRHSEGSAEAFKMQVEMANSLEHVLLNFQRRGEDSHQRWLAELSSASSVLVDKHVASFAALVPSLQDELLTQVNALFENTHEQHLMVLEVAHEVRRSLSFLGDNIGVVHQSVERLSARTLEVASHLESHAREAQNVYRIQRDAMQTAEHLAGALLELSHQTREEMSTINGTASAVVDGLWAQSQSRGNSLSINGWTKAALFWMLEIVLRVDSKYFDSLVQLPVFRFVGIIWHIVWYLLQMSFSSAMSMAVLFFSTRLWLSGSSESGHVSVSQGLGKGKCANPVSPNDLKLTSVALCPDSHNAFVAFPGSRCHPRSRTSRIPDRLLSASIDSFRL